MYMRVDVHSKIKDDFCMFEQNYGTLFGFNPINILAMVCIMYCILFQCIKMIKREKYTISMIFCKIVIFTFLA